MSEDNRSSDAPLSGDTRVRIIQTVQSPLGFFVLVVLIVEFVLGVAVTKLSGGERLVALFGMVLLIIGLVATVAFLAYYRPESLRGDRPSRTTQDHETVEVITKYLGLWTYRIIDEYRSISVYAVMDLEIDSTTQVPRAHGKVWLDNMKPDPENHFATWQSILICIRDATMYIIYQIRPRLDLIEPKETSVHPLFEGILKITLGRDIGKLDGRFQDFHPFPDYGTFYAVHARAKTFDTASNEAYSRFCNQDNRLGN